MIFSDSRAETFEQCLDLANNNQKFQATLTNLNNGKHIINVLHIWDNIFNQKARVELIIVSSARFKISKVPRAVFCGGCLQ
jgi:hypothetical protein